MMKRRSLMNLNEILSTALNSKINEVVNIEDSICT